MFLNSCSAFYFDSKIVENAVTCDVALSIRFWDLKSFLSTICHKNCDEKTIFYCERQGSKLGPISQATITDIHRYSSRDLTANSRIILVSSSRRSIIIFVYWPRHWMSLGKLVVFWTLYLSLVSCLVYQDTFKN